MAVTRFVLLLGLAGCDYVLGLERNIDASITGDAIDASSSDADEVPAEGCWTTSRQDHDEDGDRDMDGCDNCPATFNEQQEDDDGDGVGNRCDPSNTVAHRIAMFRSFHTDDDRKGFVPVGSGSWSTLNGSLVQPARTTSALISIASFRGAEVTTAIGMVSEPDTAASEVGLYASYNESLMDRLQCYASRNPSGSSSVHFQRIGAGSTMSYDPTNNLGPLVSMKLIVADQTNSPRCDLDTLDDASLPLMGIGPLEGSVAIFTRNSTAEIRYLLVITPR